MVRSRDVTGDGSVTQVGHRAAIIRHGFRPRLRALAPDRPSRHHERHAVAHGRLPARPLRDVAGPVRCAVPRSLPRTRGLIDQLIRAVGGISANLEEGYGRSGPHDRARFYEYALCTARESRGWYYKCSIAFPRELLATRMGRLTEIIRILTVVVPQERDSELRWNTSRRKRGSRRDPEAPQ